MSVERRKKENEGTIACEFGGEFFCWGVITFLTQGLYWVFNLGFFLFLKKSSFVRFFNDDIYSIR